MKEPESSAPCSAVFYRTFPQLPTVGAQLDTTHYTPHLLETYFFVQELLSDSLLPVSGFYFLGYIPPMMDKVMMRKESGCMTVFAPASLVKKNKSIFV